MVRFQNSLSLFTASLFLFLNFSGQVVCAFSEEIRIVAIVNDEVITQKELDRALAPMYFQMQATLSPERLAQEMQAVKETVLDKLIEARIMLQEAADPKAFEVSKGKMGTPPAIEVPLEEVQGMFDEARSQFQDETGFKAALSQQGLTADDLRKHFEEQITIQKLIDREVRARVAVSPTEITAYYQQNQEKFKLPPAVQVATILIRPKDPEDLERARSQAEDLQQMLAQGEDFYELARRFSDGLNAEQGGRIGYMEQGRSIREIDEILFKLQPGDISPIVRTPAGYHLFLIESFRPSRQAKLDELRTKIRRVIREKKAQVRFKTWMAKLKADSYISIK